MSLRLLLLLLLLGSTTLAQEVTPSPSPSPEPPVSLTIWWPDSLALSAENTINPILLEQSEAFAENQSNLLMEHRLKAVGTTGGIMSMLRNASSVAPNALPSVTLLRRQDLVLAQREGLIRSLEGAIPSSIQGDLSNVLALGQINGELYGLPYLVDLQMMVYRPQAEADYSDWSYAAFLERGQSFVFAAGRNNGINDTLLLQYLNDGGSINPEGMLELNPITLLHSFEFYQAASELGLVTNASLEYTSPSAYQADFASGVYDMAVFNSSSYLQLYTEESTLATAPIPTEKGEYSSILNGWVWVLVTDEPRERAAAIDYIQWMMDSNRQAEFAVSSFNIPSRQSAMNLGLAGNAPLDPLLQLLEKPLLPLSDSETGELGIQMQLALTEVLNGASDAESAAQSIISQAPQ